MERTVKLVLLDMEDQIVFLCVMAPYLPTLLYVTVEDHVTRPMFVVATRDPTEACVKIVMLATEDQLVFQCVTVP